MPIQFFDLILNNAPVLRGQQCILPSSLLLESNKGCPAAGCPAASRLSAFSAERRTSRKKKDLHWPHL
jgi:hypothetical protein